MRNKCQICKKHDAEWAMQYVGEPTPTFYTLGSHIRGFRVTKVCDACKQQAEQAEGLDAKDFRDIAASGATEPWG